MPALVLSKIRGLKYQDQRGRIPFNKKKHIIHHRVAMTKLSNVKRAVKVLLAVAVVVTVAGLTFLFLQRCS